MRLNIAVLALFLSLTVGLVITAAGYASSSRVSSIESSISSEGSVAGVRTVKTEMIVAAINNTRAKFDVPPLQVDDKINELTAARANDMVQKQYYAHFAPNGAYFADLLPLYGLRRTLPACENLYMGARDEQVVVSEWLESTSHRQCLLSADYARVGSAKKLFSTTDSSKQYITVVIFAASR